VPRNSQLSDAARTMNARRKSRAGGRPRTAGPRCPCGEMTAKRAKARYHKCGRDAR
jgi:hypothetical protein